MWGVGAQRIARINVQQIVIDAWLDLDYQPKFDVEILGVNDIMSRALARTARKAGARVRRRCRYV